LANVLRNALEFSPSDQAVQITIDGGLVCVRDHGPGIPDFALERLGERFFSLPRPGNGRKGSGLGLAFAILVTRLHGGDFGLSNHPDGGAEARMRFR
jgi:two-component system, OmpR family, sensor histidine kinase CreC